MKRLLALGVACGVTLLLPQGAMARDRDEYERVSIRVDASALDLSTGAGVDELEKRVDRAVSRICGSDRYCRDEAWASADDQVRYAIAHDEWMRRMANERIAELDRCGGDCRRGEVYVEGEAVDYTPPPTTYAPPPPPPPVQQVRQGGVTVTIITTNPPVYYSRPAPPPPPPGYWQH